MAYNRITAEIGESRRITTRPISYQYDTVQILMLTAAEGIELPEFYQVDFCVIGDEDTVTMVGSLSGGAPIPDSLLRQGENLMAYLVLTGTESDVQTRYEITIPVNERPTRSGIELTDEQQAQVDSLVEALNEGVDQAEAAAESVQNMGVEAETLAAGSSASVEKTVDPETGEVTLTFGIPRGDQGNPGTTPDFQIGTVETLPPTSPATATITGTPAEPVLNLGIPQGQKGDPGGSTGTTDYRELENKPQINGHTLNGDQSASDLGLGTYSKPGTGIPKTDLASDVQQSLDKADSALQSAPVSSVAGKTGAVQLNAGDIEFDDSETYAAGSIGAEVSQQKNAFDELNRQIDAVLDNENATSLWEQGHIVAGTGANSTGQSYGRIRTKTYIPENVVEIVADEGYTFLPYAYQQDGTYVGIYNGTTYVTTMPSAFLTGRINLKDLSQDYCWRVLVEKYNSTLTDADGAHLKFLGYTDDTLTKSGKAADAKIVGQNFGEVMPNIVSNINPFFQKWDIGHTINSSGVYEANSYVAYTPVFYDAENTYVYTGAAKDSNNVAFFCYVHEYDSSFQWLNRHAINLPNAPIILDITSSNCKYIRLVFGRAGSTGVTFQESDLSYFSMTVTENKLKMIPIQPNPVATIPAGTVNALYALVEDYFNYAYQPEGISGLVYSSEASENANSAWSSTVEPVQTVGGTDQYTIQCSGFANLVLRGVSFKNSRYTSGTNGSNIGQPWGYHFDDSTKALNVSNKNILFSFDLVKYAQHHGYLYTVNQDGNNVRAGDLLFTVQGASTNYMGIVHVMVVLETGEDGRVVVAEATDVATRTVDGVDYPVGLRTEIYNLKSNNNVCFGARFPLGAVTQDDTNIVLMMKPLISGTYSNNEIVKSYILNDVKQGLYTLIVRGDFSVPPKAAVRYTNGSVWYRPGEMLKSGNIYRMPIYITEDVDRVGISAPSGSMTVANYDLFCFAHGYYSPETDLKEYTGWLEYPNKGRFLEANEDLNNLTVGEYLCNSGTIASSLLHCPTTSNFHLSMFWRTYDYPTQVIYGSNGCIYMRSWTSQGWQNWFKFQDTDDLSNAISQKQDAPSTAGTAGQVLGLDSNLSPVWLNQSGGGSAETVVTLYESAQLGTDMDLIEIPLPSQYKKIFVRFQCRINNANNDLANGQTNTIFWLGNSSTFDTTAQSMSVFPVTYIRQSDIFMNKVWFDVHYPYVERYSAGPFGSTTWSVAEQCKIYGSSYTVDKLTSYPTSLFIRPYETNSGYLFKANSKLCVYALI